VAAGEAPTVGELPIGTGAATAADQAPTGVGVTTAQAGVIPNRGG